MEKRKVNLVGQNTLTISLPSEFVNKSKIEKGDELYVQYDQNEIVFSLKAKKEPFKDKIIDIENYSYHKLKKILFLYYIAGYKQLTLLHKKNKIISHQKNDYINLNKALNNLTSNFLGGEIISQTKEKTEIEFFITDTEETKLEKIEHRILFLFKQTCIELIEAIDEDFSEFNDIIYTYHDNIDKFKFFYLRKLPFSGKSEIEINTAHSFFMFIGYLVDKLRHVSTAINKYGCSLKLKEYIKEIFNLLFDQIKEISKNSELSENIITKRYELIKRIKNDDYTSEEFKVLLELNVFLDTINYFSKYITSKNIE